VGIGFVLIKQVVIALALPILLSAQMASLSASLSSQPPFLAVDFSFYQTIKKEIGTLQYIVFIFGLLLTSYKA
jgi:hypothetical protein